MTNKDFVIEEGPFKIEPICMYNGTEHKAEDWSLDIEFESNDGINYAYGDISIPFETLQEMVNFINEERKPKGDHMDKYEQIEEAIENVENALDSMRMVAKDFKKQEKDEATESKYRDLERLLHYGSLWKSNYDTILLTGFEDNIVTFRSPVREHVATHSRMMLDDFLLQFTLVDTGRIKFSENLPPEDAVINIIRGPADREYVLLAVYRYEMLYKLPKNSNTYQGFPHQYTEEWFNGWDADWRLSGYHAEKTCESLREKLEI